MAGRLFPALLVIGFAITLSFLTVPVVAIFADTSPRELVDRMGDPAVLDALRLSLEATTIALAAIVLLGTPTAWLLATRDFPGRRVAVTLVELPLVLPPAVAGIGLLAAFGPGGIAGGGIGDDLVFQTAGVVVALTFVASPFYVRQAQAAFAALDPTLLDAARTLGAGEARAFLTVGVPGAAGGLAAGAALAWGRALGEFGATLVFAGSLSGVTQTAPLAIYADFATDFPAALALSAVLVAVSGAVLLGVKLATGSGLVPDAHARG